MGPLSRETWAQRLGAFRDSPSAFLAGAEGEDLGRDLLSDLRNEKLSEQTKVGPAVCPALVHTAASYRCMLIRNFLLNPPTSGFLTDTELGVL